MARSGRKGSTPFFDRQLQITFLADVPEGFLTPAIDNRSPRAVRWADLLTCWHDMSRVSGICERLAQELVKPPADADADEILTEALWVAAVITYGRVFKQGIRNPPAIGKLDALATPDAKRVHQHVLLMRDKHIAHAASPFEQTPIVTFISKPDRPEQLASGWFSVRLTVPEIPLVSELGKLAAAVALELERLADLQRLQVEKETGETGWATLYAIYCENTEGIEANPH